MRPVRLEVEGFTVFRTPTVVDFAGADLFALVGPTGAGKTSTIDALTFALYGSVPRLDDRRAVAPVISQNLTEARVRLDFTVGGQAYTAVRVVRATKAGGATTKEARLERAGEVLAGTADEVTDAVTALLGLTFDHFTTCVSLPQGQFARFLHDKPRSRQDLLVKLLDLGLYDRVATAARARAAVARGRVDLTVGQLERLSGATPEARVTAAERVAALAALDERLAAERPLLDELNAGVVAAEAAAAEATDRLALLDRLVAPPGVTELAADVAAADRARRRCADRDAEAVAAVAEAEAAVALLPERAALDRQRRDHARRAELTETIERGEVADREAQAALVDAAEAVDRSTAVHADAQAERERVLVALRARALVPELVAGEPCPVCGQEVADLPAHEPVADRDVAERAVVDADKALARARKVHGDAQAQQARVDEKLVRLRAELAEVAERLDGAGDLDALEAELARVDTAATALDKARQSERDARKALAEATRAHEAQVGREAEARRAYDAARDTVASSGPPAAERRDLAADWRALVAWAAEQAPGLSEAAAAQRHAVEQGRRQVAERLRALLAACEDAAVEVTPARWPGEAVAAAHARAEAEVARIDEQVAEAERLRAERTAATEQHQVADMLASHLAANRFEKWLLDEALQQLVATASTLLLDLSAGAYALTVDGRSGGFGVVDHTHAAQVRSARTLSGGETFLASLALALALADQVAGLASSGSARLESLFLDEGFGTLDPDTLDVVATALDELGARGRMVGVVTHVRELAERLPVRFEVRKVGGSAVVERVEA